MGDQTRSAILSTKFYIPEPRHNLVVRNRLFKNINEGLDKKLSLISAPAGFGKSTLISSWIKTSQLKVGWLTIDTEDNDPVRFFTYLIKLILHERGSGLLDALQSPHPPPFRTITSSLISELAQTSEIQIFVLDDYHLISSPVIHQELSFFLENLPLNKIHFIISTREDPPFHIGRLRAQAEMNEIRAADLRFTNKEISEFLTGSMSLGITQKQINALDKKTEGWIAGLQLAAVSMKSISDIGSFIDKFTGSHRFILDYLIEEVLRFQTQEFRSFLLSSSILDQMCASLCESVTGLHDCQKILEELDKNNLFLIPMDDERKWYRYHHLFSDFLVHKLRSERPEDIETLFLKASDWCLANDQIGKAIEYSLRAPKIDRAVDLIEPVIESKWQHGEHETIAAWMKMLPLDNIQNNPQLSIFYAWNLFTRGLQLEAEEFLSRLENSLGLKNEQLQSQSNCPAKTISDEEKTTFLGRAEMMRAYMASYRSDAVAILRHGNNALKYLPKSDKNWINTAYVALGDAQVFSGDYQNAIKTQQELLQQLNTHENIYLFLNASMKHALALRAQGQFERALSICRRSSRLAQEYGLAQSEMAGWIYAVWGETLAEINDLDLADEYVRKGLSLTELGNDVAMYSWCLQSFTRVMYSRNDAEMVRQAIGSANELIESAVIPRWVIHIIYAWQIRLWLQHGEIQPAAEFLLRSGITLGQTFDYVDGIAYTSLARVLSAQGRFDQARDLISHLYQQAAMGNHIERMLVAGNLNTLALSSMGDEIQASLSLEKTLSTAQPLGYCRIFIDEGPQMESLLRNFQTGPNQLLDYKRYLLSVFSEDRNNSVVGNQPLVEPLSDRELELLSFLAQGLTNKQIAEKLFLSKNTVKTHFRNIYQKLGVSSRVQAVQQAHALGILASD